MYKYGRSKDRHEGPAKNQWGPEGYKDWEKTEEDAKFRVLVGLEGEMGDKIKIVGDTIMKMMEYRKDSVNEV